MRKFSLGIFLISLITLMTELVLTRVFDVILNQGLGYIVITCAMFSFGLSGIYATLRPLPVHRNVDNYLSLLALLVALSTLAILPITNLTAIDYRRVTENRFLVLIPLLAIYLSLIVPFFLSGLIFATLFTTCADKVQSLYFWDLVGAALGCIVLVPFIPLIGPGGLLFLAAACALFASGLFSARPSWSGAALVSGLIIISVPIARMPEYYDFREIIPKRDVKRVKDVEAEKLEFTRWDPISKIDVIDQGTRKHIAYDGGQQSSHIFPFDGDFSYLREHMADEVQDHFWIPGVLASHYLKRDTDPKVLIIGSAGGQEVKAALTYGAAQIEGVDLVGTVIELGKKQYAKYNGNILNEPNVHLTVGEGRSVLRASSQEYDIIQIFSNHTSSSIANGNGALSTTYLLTVEAFLEYFKHLAPNGILHINHHIYPRMVTTAALAWRQMGREDFQKHVVVFEKTGKPDMLPTFLVKMDPWTEKELKEVIDLFSQIPRRQETTYRLAEDPLHPERSDLSPTFYDCDFPADLAEKIDFRVMPVTDDKPFFDFLRRKIRILKPDPNSYMSLSVADHLNSSIRDPGLPLGILIPMDSIQFTVTGAVALFFASIFIFAPLYYSSVGKRQWTKKFSSIAYFSCLGSGFIIIEVVFVQIFMKLIGFPLYAFSVVIFSLLLAAGIGSLSSRKLDITPDTHWTWPFLGILATGCLLTAFYPCIFHFFLASPLPVRVLVSSLLILPLGFFLGMPFPLGILSLRGEPQGAIAWAWGMNAFFTVVGGLGAVVLSISVGFRMTTLFAYTIYSMAFFIFARIRRTVI